ncbi:MAG TPA: SUMF1/EgtB/PvdO family nonheme iron enzyme [Bacteriovoracaceae bacterium]|nr:SUMF1/EgtB/PvdO family nonheme iron enzyme [Bacteriovoracaceae bacterium]
MDRFEAPNVAGAQPLAAQTAIEGEAWCAVRSKRLCTEIEWMKACQGRSKYNYPYGANYERSRCTDDKVWKAPDWKLISSYPSPEGKAEVERLYQADASGSRTGCISEDGVYDLTGNVTEWVARSHPNRTNYKHVMKGCYWVGCSQITPPNCAYTNLAHPGTFRSYEAGFRCCSN